VFDVVKPSYRLGGAGECRVSSDIFNALVTNVNGATIFQTFQMLLASFDHFFLPGFNAYLLFDAPPSLSHRGLSIKCFQHCKQSVPRDHQVFESRSSQNRQTNHHLHFGLLA
jgi:hypothetical protein